MPFGAKVHFFWHVPVEQPLRLSGVAALLSACRHALSELAFQCKAAMDLQRCISGHDLRGAYMRLIASPCSESPCSEQLACTGLPLMLNCG